MQSQSLSLTRRHVIMFDYMLFVVWRMLKCLMKRLTRPQLLALPILMRNWVRLVTAHVTMHHLFHVESSTEVNYSSLSSQPLSVHSGFCGTISHWSFHIVVICIFCDCSDTVDWVTLTRRVPVLWKISHRWLQMVKMQWVEDSYPNRKWSLEK